MLLRFFLFLPWAMLCAGIANAQHGPGHTGCEIKWEEGGKPADYKGFMEKCLASVVSRPAAPPPTDNKPFVQHPYPPPFWPESWKRQITGQKGTRHPRPLRPPKSVDLDRRAPLANVSRIFAEILHDHAKRCHRGRASDDWFMLDRLRLSGAARQNKAHVRMHACGRRSRAILGNQHRASSF
jgi:hypothetical protein